MLCQVALKAEPAEIGIVIDDVVSNELMITRRGGIADQELSSLVSLHRHSVDLVVIDDDEQVAERFAFLKDQLIAVCRVVTVLLQPCDVHSLACCIVGAPKHVQIAEIARVQILVTAETDSNDLSVSVDCLNEVGIAHKHIILITTPGRLRVSLSQRD